MRATLHLELRSQDGQVLARRRADNSVMVGGAQLIANLFAGLAQVPITHMRVGVNGDDADRYDHTTLTRGEGEDALVGEIDAPIDPGAFVISLDTVRRYVLVRVQATLTPESAVGTIREAGLIARGPTEEDVTLYNRVIFAPIVKQSNHELTLFWEVVFPYGDLQWFE